MFGITAPGQGPSLSKVKGRLQQLDVSTVKSTEKRMCPGYLCLAGSLQSSIAQGPAHAMVPPTAGCIFPHQLTISNQLPINNPPRHAHRPTLNLGESSLRLFTNDSLVQRLRTVASCKPGGLHRFQEKMSSLATAMPVSQSANYSASRSSLPHDIRHGPALYGGKNRRMTEACWPPA